MEQERVMKQQGVMEQEGIIEQKPSTTALTQPEELLQYLFKIDGVIELLLIKDLKMLPISQLYNCLLTVKNLTSTAIEINEKLLPKVSVEFLLGKLPSSAQPSSGNSSLQKEGYTDNLSKNTEISDKASGRSDRKISTKTNEVSRYGK